MALDFACVIEVQGQGQTSAQRIGFKVDNVAVRHFARQRGVDLVPGSRKGGRILEKMDVEAYLSPSFLLVEES